MKGGKNKKDDLVRKANILLFAPQLLQHRPAPRLCQQQVALKNPICIYGGGGSCDAICSNLITISVKGGLSSFSCAQHSTISCT
mmetsp:Transcript_11940/g.32295  ORF Transcript_11940/g.32295 Transcript_11940/m.32295 type:complete len:84 (-) Transcript_11940:1386-1637(-)